jgi:diaminobutyrate acetyltransferase
VTGAIVLRAPRPSDGAAMWALVREAGTLDANSAYLYVLLADRFRDTCALAERDGRVVAMLTGFRPPADPSAYFVWQIGVHPEARGAGLASRLIDAVLARHPDVRFVEATVSPSNAPSLALFGALARRRGAPLETLEGYGPELFPTAHEREPLLRIGPLASTESHSPPRSPS